MVVVKNDMQKAAVKLQRTERKRGQQMTCCCDPRKGRRGK